MTTQDLEVLFNNSIPTAPTNLLLFSVTYRSFLSYPPTKVRTDAELRPGVLPRLKRRRCKDTHTARYTMGSLQLVFRRHLTRTFDKHTC
jgi:hypothetical protein